MSPIADPVPGTLLHITGQTPGDRMADIDDRTEALEANAYARTSSNVLTPDAFSPLPEVMITDSETTSGWGGVTVDAVEFTHGTHSVTKKLRSDPGRFDSMIYNAPLPVPTVGYGTLSLDIRWTEGINSQPSEATFFDIVVADGASLGGNAVRIAAPAFAHSVWITVDMDISSLTQVRSVGIQGVRDVGSSTGGGLNWWVDYVRLDAQAALGVAVVATPGVIVPPSYPPSFADHISYPNRTTLDLRPSFQLLQRHGGVRDIREWDVADDGSEDVSGRLSAILASLPSGSTLRLTPQGQYLNDSTVVLKGTDLTIDGQGALLFTTRDRGDLLGTNSNPDHFVTLSGDGLTVRNLHLIGGRTLNINMVPSVGVAAGPTPFHLTTIGQEIMTDPAQVYYCGRDKDGLIKIRVGNISQTNAIANDCLVRMVDGVTGQEMARMYPVLTTTPTAFTISVDGAAWLGSQPRAFISKVSSLANDISAGAGTKTLYNPVDYRGTHDAATGYLVMTGVGITIEDCRIEGMQTDGVSMTVTTAEYLTVRRVQSICNSRQGMSFNKGRHILVEDCVIRESGRTGIDIEPYSADWAVWYISIKGVEFRNIPNNAISCNNYLQIWHADVEDCVAYNCGLGFAAGGGHFAKFTNIRNFGVDFTPRGRNMVIDHITTDGVFSVSGMSGTYDASISPSADPDIAALGPITYSAAGGSGNQISNIVVERQQKSSALTLSGTAADTSLQDDIATTTSYPYYGPIHSGSGELSGLNPGRWGELLPGTFKGLGFSSIWSPGGRNLHNDPLTNVRALGGTLTKGNNFSAVGVAAVGTTATVVFPARTVQSLQFTQPTSVGGGTLAAGTYYIAAGPRNRWGARTPTIFNPVTVGANGAINLHYTTGWDTGTELVYGITWWRAGPAASLPATYNTRYDWVPNNRFYGGRRVLGMDFRDAGTVLSCTNITVSQDPQIFGYPGTVAAQSGTFTPTGETGVEPDTSYGVMIETSWPTNWSIAAKRIGGFDIVFTTAAPPGATFSWLLVRP